MWYIMISGHLGAVTMGTACLQGNVQYRATVTLGASSPAGPLLLDSVSKFLISSHRLSKVCVYDCIHLAQNDKACKSGFLSYNQYKLRMVTDNSELESNMKVMGMNTLTPIQLQE